MGRGEVSRKRSTSEHLRRALAWPCTRTSCLRSAAGGSPIADTATRSSCPRSRKATRCLPALHRRSPDLHTMPGSHNKAGGPTSKAAHEKCQSGRQGHGRTWGSASGLGSGRLRFRQCIRRNKRPGLASPDSLQRVASVSHDRHERLDQRHEPR
jgi:hypothetical protein